MPGPGELPGVALRVGARSRTRAPRPRRLPSQRGGYLPRGRCDRSAAQRARPADLPRGAHPLPLLRPGHRPAPGDRHDIAGDRRRGQRAVLQALGRRNGGPSRHAAHVIAPHPQHRRRQATPDCPRSTAIGRGDRVASFPSPDTLSISNSSPPAPDSRRTGPRSPRPRPGDPAPLGSTAATPRAACSGRAAPRTSRPRRRGPSARRPPAGSPPRARRAAPPRETGRATRRGGARGSGPAPAALDHPSRPRDRR